ncbi:Crp/Fnr family transcriptional regulator [Pectinatus sottacetonis]|uniref:Crp/Fnr family transcriptional regulator n=1 Tax=Pectinatus sottacetonis TaxID=1002795 RepID=UPI0018C6E0C1|nr:Crp/Fnr family transcriptional regulator [Pectinatus sottacetonis]
MHQNLFIEDQQTLMRDYFLNELAQHGTIKHYNKRQTITADPVSMSIGIVVKGQVTISVISSKGQEKILYTLLPGECFGEMNLLSDSFFNYIIKVKKNTWISFVHNKKFNLILKNNPAVYQYFINVIIIKFRIVLLQMVSNIFNNSAGKIADTLLRLSLASVPLKNSPADNNTIAIPFTQGELANITGCSRITVTRILNQFINKNFISISNKKIIIKNPEALLQQSIHLQ